MTWYPSHQAGPSTSPGRAAAGPGTWAGAQQGVGGAGGAGGETTWSRRSSRWGSWGWSWGRGGDGRWARQCASTRGNWGVNIWSLGWIASQDTETTPGPKKVLGTLLATPPKVGVTIGYVNWYLHLVLQKLLQCIKGKTLFYTLRVQRIFLFTFITYNLKEKSL